MNEKPVTANKILKEKWSQQMEELWPAIKGSLAQVSKPCIRKNCQACASGKKHPAWMLSVADQGRRSTLYVPEVLVAEVKLAIQNGRKIEKLLHKAAINLVKRHRSQAKKPHETKLKS